MRRRAARWISLGSAMFCIVAGQVAATPLPLLGVQQISAGSFGTCAVVAGTVECWGGNILAVDYFNGTAYGYLTLSSVPVIIPGLNSVTQVSAAQSHQCGLINGGVKCWGNGNYGATGPNGGGTSLPVAVDGATSGATAVSAGGINSCAIVNGGALCWGDNFFGQLGNASVPSGYYSAASATPVAVTGLESNVTKIAVSSTPLPFEDYAGHACAVHGGVAECWGDNAHGQLGHDTIPAHTYGTAAAPVSGLPAGVSDITSGDEHSCAVVNGAAFCWGRNYVGQLGNSGVPVGYASYSQTPVAVQGLGSGVIAVSASGYHSCALVNNDTAHPVKCWGNNAYGELGNGTTANSATPVNVEFFPALTAANQVTAITSGSWHTCALIVTSGTTRTQCWGDNEAGQLGNDDAPVNNPIPQSVAGISANVTSIAAGGDTRHGCAVVSGSAWCWGANGAGQLGDGLNTDRSVALGVTGLASGVSQIANGGDYTCAIVSGAAKCWGDGYRGVLGSGNQSSHITPAAVSGLASGVTRIAATGSTQAISSSGGGVSFGGHACAVVAGGVQCWGENIAGELGNVSVATGSYSSVPVVVTGISGASDVAVGYTTSCAVIAGGVQCWGQRVGNSGYPSGSLAPVLVTGLDSGVTALVGGSRHFCALVNGLVKCWGDNQYGQIGNKDSSGQPAIEPVTVFGLSNVTAIAASALHNCAVVDGGVLCWGSNYSGELGATAVNKYCQFSCSSLAQPVAGLGAGSGVTALSAGSAHSCALIGSSSIKCWGNDFNGQLGDGRFLIATTPQGVNLGESIFQSSFEP